MTQRSEYLEAAVHRLLTEHPGLGEQGIRVAPRDSGVLLCGEVESPQRKAEVERLVAQHFPDVEVRSDIVVTRVHPTIESEELS